MLNKLRKLIVNKSFCVGFFVILIFIIAWFNKFPQGYVFSSGDSYQCVDCSKFADNFFKYSWQENNTGGGNISQAYYGFYFLISKIQNVIGVENIVMLYYFCFLTLSFLSFRFSIKTLLGYNKCELFLSSFSFIYAVSPMVLYFYMVFNFGHILLYSLIPLIFSLIYIYIKEDFLVSRYLFYLAGVLFLCNTSFGNAALFTALNIFIFLYIILLYVIVFRVSENKDVSFFFRFVKKSVALYFLFFLVTFFSIIPQLPTLIGMNSGMHNGVSNWNLSTWILWASAKMDNLLFFTATLDINMNIFSYLVLIPGVVLFYYLIESLFEWKKQKINRVMFIIVVVAIFLSNKGKGFLDSSIINYIFSSNIILSSIKSNDKTSIFLPFFAFIPIFWAISKTKKNIIIFYIFVFVIYFISIIPFIFGEINRNYAGFKKDNNYLTSDYTTIVKIPNEYFKLSDKFSYKKYDFRILVAPWNAINSVGWVNYSKWKMVGADITTHLFNQSTLSASNFLDGWLYMKSWNEQSSENSVWLLPFSGFLNSKYIIYHKDVDKIFITQTKDKINFYENNNLLTKLEDNDYFNLYKVSEKYYLPHIYTPTENIISKRATDDFPRMLLSQDLNVRSAFFFKFKNILCPTSKMNEFKKCGIEEVSNSKLIEDLPQKIENPPVLEYKKINPTKYRVRAHGASGISPLVFSESFHDGWKAYLAKPNQETRSKKQEVSLGGYKILDGNSEDQASKNELTDYIKNGWITTLGDGKEKVIEHKKWEDIKEKPDYVEKYKIDFISKNFQGTIQNDNLSNGNFWETWLKKPLPENDHLMVNGYANSWVIDVNRICGNNSGIAAVATLPRNDNRAEEEAGRCVKNADGTYDFELVVEFWPQRLFYVGLGISGTTLLGCIGYLIYDWRKRRKNKTELPVKKIVI